MSRRELEILAARLAIEWLSRYEIFSFADDLISQGNDDDTLMEIYVDGAERWNEPQPLFAKYLAEQGVSIPDRDSALIDLAYRYAKQALDGETEPIDAAHSIEYYCIDKDKESNCMLGAFASEALVYDFAVTEADTEAIELRCRDQAKMLCEQLVRDFEDGVGDRWLLTVS